MKRFLVAVTLTCVLSVSAMAGSIPTCGAPSPDPDPNGVTSEAPGDMPTAGLTAPGEIPSDGLSAFLMILDLVF